MIEIVLVAIAIAHLADPPQMVAAILAVAVLKIFVKTTRIRIIVPVGQAGVALVEIKSERVLFFICNPSCYLSKIGVFRMFLVFC